MQPIRLVNWDPFHLAFYVQSDDHDFAILLLVMPNHHNGSALQLLFLLLLLSFVATSGFIVRNPATLRRAKQTCAAAGSLEDDPTLLSVRCNADDAAALAGAKAELISWIRGFPFAASLPVQPLNFAYPEDGLDVQFRRKKTEGKDGKDGGIRIRVTDTLAASGDGAGAELHLAAIRDSEGQFISKSIAEKKLLNDLANALTSAMPSMGLVVTSVSSFYGWQQRQTPN